MNLRLIQKEDVHGIWRNFNEVVDEQIYLPVFSKVEEDWEMACWYDDLKRDGNLCIIAEDPEQPEVLKIVGQCTIENIEWEAAKHVGQLGIIVQKGYRNFGLGYFLIEFAKEMAKTHGKKKIVLSTFESNSLGIALYKKTGFTIIGRYTKQFFIQNHYENEVLMECWL